MGPFLLLAEGDAELRDLYSSFLTKHCYDIAVAEDGLDCLQQLRQATPDVLVLDLELTWGGGDGVLDWLREEGSHLEIPVILTATAGRQPSGAEARARPAVQFLAKPFALKTLEESVRAAVANKGQVASNRRRHADAPELYIG